MKLRILLLILFFVFPVFGFSQVNNQKDTSPVEVTHVAIEGFLFSSGGFKVLIDVLWPRLDTYTKPPQKVLNKVISGKKPFNDINLVIASHSHSDHFGAEPVIRFLDNNPKTVFVSSGFVVDKIRKYPESYKIHKSRIKEVTPAWNSSKKLRIDGIDLRFLSLNHNAPGEKAKYLTLGTLIKIGGKKFLHLADHIPDSNSEYFETFQLQKENIDVLFADDHFLTSFAGQAILNKYIAPKKIVVMHINFRNYERTLKKIKRYYPKALIFSETMEKMVF